MGLLKISCINCSYTGHVAEEKLPAGPITATCPKCKKAFVIDKGALQKLGKPQEAQAPPPAPPPPPAPKGPEPEEHKKAVKSESKRKRKRFIFALLSVILAAVVAASLYAHIFKLYPVIAEKALIAGLFCNIEPVQRFSITRLRSYPTKHAALSLVIFINLKNMQQAPDPKKPDTPEEKMKREAKRRSDLALAERAAETLCILSNQAFGTYYKKESYSGHSWGSIEEQRWPSVLGAMNFWALEVFGPAELSGLAPLPALLQSPPPGTEQK